MIVIFDPQEDLFSEKTVAQVREMVTVFENIDGVESVLSYLDAPLLFSPKMSMSELVDNLRTIEDEGADKDLPDRNLKIALSIPNYLLIKRQITRRCN